MFSKMFFMPMNQMVRGLIFFRSVSWSVCQSSCSFYSIQALSDDINIDDLMTLVDLMGDTVFETCPVFIMKITGKMASAT